MSSATVVDYGVVNLRNILQGLEHVGANTQVTKDPDLILKADRVILPGVGAFSAGIAELRSRNLDQALHAVVKKGRPLLGICLGMQLMLSVSEENGNWPGLDLIEGKVVRFTGPAQMGKPYKIPQIGWNSISKPGNVDVNWKNSVLESLDTEDTAYVYFLHSYFFSCRDNKQILTSTDYHGSFTSIFRNNNIYGVVLISGNLIQTNNEAALISFNLCNNLLSKFSLLDLVIVNF